MAFKLVNKTEVITMFQVIDKEVTQGARQVLREYAEKIKDTAVEFAPVEEHRLEKAIKILPSQGNQYTLRMTIAVGGTVDGRDVSEYATIVHEYQWSKRGLFTRLKGPRAGPRYLSRAVEFHRKELTIKLTEAMSTGISQGINRSGVNKNKRRR